ncbi:MAG: NADH-quinone oxidoreductase subunit C [Alphaproteobacteria bacterium]|nr:NADH-quinone oxidoreductase subunit C [Alphaproteobacteria bacterium]
MIRQINTDALRDLSDYLGGALGDQVAERALHLDELTITVSAGDVVSVLTTLRDDQNCHFRQLVDISGVDYPERDKRFDVSYHLLSHRHNMRLRVIVRADENTPVPSVAGLFPNANWYEREIWDLYGVFFSDHPDLRRILTDYGFEGHPLRKDFPLTGYVEVRYDDEQKRVVYDKVNLTQEFRHWDFMSPWEGMTPEALPGDEKADGASEEGGQ